MITILFIRLPPSQKILSKLSSGTDCLAWPGQTLPYLTLPTTMTAPSHQVLFRGRFVVAYPSLPLPGSEFLGVHAIDGNG